MIKLSCQKTISYKEVFHMNSITQELKYKQSIVKYALRNGVTAASIVYKKHRKTIYKWIDKYDGTIASLANKSRRPHTNLYTFFSKSLNFNSLLVIISLNMVIIPFVVVCNYIVLD